MAWIHVQFFSLILMSLLESVVLSELGFACVKDSQCEVNNSYCSSGVCTCKHYYAPLGTTACVESKLLGRECMVSEQCLLRVANSTCKDGHCHCSRGFVRFRKHTCLPPAKMGDVCYSDDHCQLWTKNSHCKFLIPKLFGKCVCDGEGNCAPEEFPKLHSENFIALKSPRPSGTTPETFIATEMGERYKETTKNKSEDNKEPGKTSAPFVDPFLHQKEHNQESLSRPFVSGVTKKVTIGTTGKGSLEEHQYTPTKSEVTPSEIFGHGDTTKFPLENFKHRVETNEKETKKSDAQRSAVKGVSLGYPCQMDGDCQKVDEGSLCLDGVCDCAIKTNRADACGRDNTGCGPETFQCKNSGLCISWFFVCDGRNDCPDNSDEECEGLQCPRPSLRCGTSGFCVSLAAICDGLKNCPNGEDEIFCTPDERNTTQGCPDDSFRCANGQCLPKFEFCNATPKCSDGSDEFPHLCSSQVNRKTNNKKREYCPFECSNGRCRSTAIVCSGRDGCGDNSDEAHCSVCRCPARPPQN